MNEPIELTTEDDFQHFISYSGLRNESDASIEKMRRAFYSARDAKDNMMLPECTICCKPWDTCSCFLKKGQDG